MKLKSKGVKMEKSMQTKTMRDDLRLNIHILRIEYFLNAVH